MKKEVEKFIEIGSFWLKENFFPLLFKMKKKWIRICVWRWNEVFFYYQKSKEKMLQFLYMHTHTRRYHFVVPSHFDFVYGSGIIRDDWQYQFVLFKKKIILQRISLLCTAFLFDLWNETNRQSRCLYLYACLIKLHCPSFLFHFSLTFHFITHFNTVIEKQ